MKDYLELKAEGKAVVAKTDEGEIAITRTIEVQETKVYTKRLLLSDVENKIVELEAELTATQSELASWQELYKDMVVASEGGK